MPVPRRSSAGAATSRSGIDRGAAAALRRFERPAPAAVVAVTTTSSSVFHSEQPGHCPDQASDSWPQSRQT